MSEKYVYLFSEGNGKMRELLGGKGANLAEMTILGLPVPQGFTVTTAACANYYENSKSISKNIENEIYESLKKLEEKTNKKFGNAKKPLLLSVRSGARASMPGMMDTILNLGLNDEVTEGLAHLTQNPRFAYDSYRRFIQMFSDVVMELPKSEFEKIIDDVKKERSVSLDTELNVDDMKDLVYRFKSFYKKSLNEDFPSEPRKQLIEAIKAVFRSWDNPRANVYRRMNDIPYSWGTAVNVQEMVFGNTGIKSGTGVAFTRNPATGEPRLFGEYLINAQGEDVVAGIRTPQNIDNLKDSMPDVYEKFVKIASKLENHYSDMQDMEFTIENGKLYMLQTRNGKRTADAALKIAVDLVEEGKISKEEALLRVDPKQLDSLLHPQFNIDALSKAKSIGKGLAASPGAACGKVVFSAQDAKEWHNNGEKVILVRLETSPEDIEGMSVAEGILTVRGGMTSHAAVVARGMGTCCVSGCTEIKINESEKYFTLGTKIIHEGDYISLNGSTGEIYAEKIPTSEATISGYFNTFMQWADSNRKLKVRTNADTPADAEQAIKFGAEGIGLCRTEHMFFDENRIKAIREMIVVETSEERKRALDKILPFQQSDFEEMYKVLEGRPMTIRFLDPPLHEFLPTKKDDITEIAQSLNISTQHLENIIKDLHEFNPMMGHRGCRLAVSYPEIAIMQTKAVINAAININREHPEYKIAPEIMIPLVGDINELKFIKGIVCSTADSLIKDSGLDMKYTVGTMIEIPRAALTANEIAKEADFFSFGTNDLTQMTFGFSRDDAGKFLNSYYEKKIYEFDPFEKLDQTGVGKLIEMASKLGKESNANLKIGICGEHGGDPSSVEFFHRVGLDYVSCSPFRVPIARLAAAQAAIKSK